MGLANCVGVAPEVFELDEADKAAVVDPFGADDHILLRAAKGCDQGRQVYP